jgi:signal peptidase I
MRGAARTWFIVSATVAVVLVGYVLFFKDTQGFRAKSEAMAPTIDLNERFTVNKGAYDDAGPQRRDIVVIRPPQGALEGTCGEQVGSERLCPRPAGDPADVQFVKRVIALPGERVGVVDGKGVIDGRPLDEPYANVDSCAGGGSCTFRGSVVVPDDHFFVMGDNRGASDDSRFWGPVPRDQIVGRVDDCWPLGLRCEEADRTG